MEQLQYKPFAFRYIPGGFSPNDWADISPLFERLLLMPAGSDTQLLELLTLKSELETVLDYEEAIRYINVNRDTLNQELASSYEHWISDIQPKVEEQMHLVNERVISSPFSAVLEQMHPVLFRGLRNEHQLFREENTQIYSELALEEQEFANIISEQMVYVDGEELTLSQATDMLHSAPRAKREEVYKAILAKRLSLSDTLSELLTSLMRKRYHIALNAGFGNFRDYQHQNLGRFDFSVADIEEFHTAVQMLVCPIADDILYERKQRMNLDVLMPWDAEVDSMQQLEHSRLLTEEQLKASARQLFCAIDPEFAHMFNLMDVEGYLDLVSRKSKAPSGFSYPLYKVNRSFIFMNATGSLRDLEVLIHEGGHSFHAFLCASQPFHDYKWTPMEVAELASMAMELFAYEHLDLLLPTDEALRSNRRRMLEDIILSIPWIVAIDKFQHWLYTHPEHSAHERNLAWVEIYKEYSSKEICWDGVEEGFVFAWQKQLHLFEVPFYYIEYAIAQLGAIALWRKYRVNKEGTIAQFKNALQLGYSKTVPEIYATAGIEFNLSPAYLKGIIDFAKEELDKLK
ncbi:MAG: M3 family oligoendopeptidase [Bacteroidales bacterium]|nr:M3 family oligoendopeptidase [Bacteroidales bacterium]MBN2748751.1 M3 family oligoendopeptidase [Bacteroidales bacterium]